MLRRSIEFPAFARACILIAATTGAIGLARAQNDTWWQLRSGQDIWRDRTVSLVDRYSYTADGNYWPDHEWLWQLIAYGLHQLGGMPLLALANGSAAIAALLLSLPRRHPTRRDVVILLTAIPLLSAAWAIRPQVTSLLLCAVLLGFIRAGRWLPIPLLMLLWANLHGAVVVGGVVLCAALGASALVQWRSRSHEAAARTRALAVVTGLSAVATLATPLGWRLWSYVLDSPQRSKLNGVQEWENAFHVNLFSIVFWGWVVAVGIACVVHRSRLLTWPTAVDAAVCLALLPVAASAIRNISFFALAAIPLLSELLRQTAQLNQTTESRRVDDDVPHGRRIVLALGLVATLVSLSLWKGPSPFLGWRPIADPAVSAIRSCPGNVYTTYNSGGFLIWFVPDRKVFVDSRQDPYPVEILSLEALGPEQDFQTTFDRYDVECAALTAADGATFDVLDAAGWKPTFGDSQWVVLEAPR